MRQVSFAEAMHWKYPEWVVMVLTADEQGRVNAMPAGWAMICSSQPPMFAVAINQRNYTHEVIQRTREFVIAFPSEGMEDAVMYCGTHSGRDSDKLAQTSLEVCPATEIRPPLLRRCRINLECKLADQLPTGDHTIFVGHVVVAHVDPSAPPNIVNFGNTHLAVAYPNRSSQSKETSIGSRTG